MSVLSFPRVHFRGTISWDPGLANNSVELFDAQRVALRLPDGVTFGNFIEHVIDQLPHYGIWNYTGTHTCRLEEDCKITGGRLSAGGALTTDDPLVGRPVGLVGKLVDLDPAAVWNSQIFFDAFSVGSDGVGLRAERTQRMHSRWINFRRSLDALPIAGGAGVVWQTATPLGRVHFEGTEHSRLLTALQQAATAPGAAGIMIRFATYRTLYFQNGLRNSLSQRPRNLADLRELYRAGEIFSNPAYSEVIGTIGVWRAGEPVGWPGGRFLAPARSIPSSVAGASPFSLGPAVAEVDSVARTLSLDLLHAVPEINCSLDKADVGPLSICVRTGPSMLELARLTPNDYGRSAYEAGAGIIDVQLPPGDGVLPAVQGGQLLVSTTPDGRNPVLLERELVALAEERSAYAEQGAPRSVSVRILERGNTPSRPVRLGVAVYRNLTLVPDSGLVVEADSSGNATVPLRVDELGPLDYGLEPFAVGDPTSAPADGLDITAGYFVSSRVLPTDADLDAIPDATLTFAIIFETVLRTWHLLNPVMAGSDIGTPLNDEATMTALAAVIRQVTDDAAFETFAGMPVTRDMSQGKRRLLHRWCAKH